MAERPLASALGKAQCACGNPATDHDTTGCMVCPCLLSWMDVLVASDVLVRAEASLLAVRDELIVWADLLDEEADGRAEPGQEDFHTVSRGVRRTTAGRLRERATALDAEVRGVAP